MEKQIFNLWNSFRSQRNKKGVWKGCSMLDGFTKSTIRQACKAHGGPERILEAIKNYHLIWHGKEYKWTYAWTLPQLLTRKDKGGIPQIRQFLPGNFRADTYLSDSEKTKRATIERAEAAKNKYELHMKSVPENKIDWRKRRADINAVRN